MNKCPCGSEKSYEQCCGVFISGKALPKTPEQLMRSRYTAYSQANIDYIVATMKGKVAEGYDKKAAKKWAEKVEWLSLTILNTKDGADENSGFVEFIADYRYQDKNQKMHEVSEFRRENEHWLYVDRVQSKNAPLSKSEKIGRNDPCSCGSGKKFKKCCGA